MSPIDRISILNHVIGPVMRGPSSSHTAGAWRIGRLAADLLGSPPRSAQVLFDSSGSYARTYTAQGADAAFICGLLDIPLTDERYLAAGEAADRAGLAVTFATGSLERADHPNALVADLTSIGDEAIVLEARSVGGGAVLLTRLDDRPLALDGSFHTLVAAGSQSSLAECAELAGDSGDTAIVIEEGLLVIEQGSPFAAAIVDRIRSHPGVTAVRTAAPVLLPPRGRPLFESAAAMVALAERRQLSLGRLALAYEAELLGLTAGEVRAEIDRRLEVMRASVRRGLTGEGLDLQLLVPSAGAVAAAEAAGTLPAGGLNTRSAARALAVMHVAASRGVICAAPTGGSAGVVAAVLETLITERGLDPERAGEALLAAGAIGLAVARKATFAAEVAGCQVEIGAAGAMAAAAVVEAAGGSPARAAGAAAIVLQNAMGSVCDLVQGIVEIPCHTRNAAAASDAFLCADLVLGGYTDPIGLDDTLTAVRQVGEAMPGELRCTARGGLAATPTAQNLPNRRAGERTG